GYRLKKFLRRNKGPVLAATVFILLLIAGIVGMTLGLLQAQASEEYAKGEAVKADRERNQAIEARKTAQEAAAAEQVQRNLAEGRAKELKRGLYLKEMNLAGQAAESAFGLAPVAELVSHWKDEPSLRGWEWYYLHGLCHQDRFTFQVGPLTD